MPLNACIAFGDVCYIRLQETAAADLAIWKTVTKLLQPACGPSVLENSCYLFVRNLLYNCCYIIADYDLKLLNVLYL